MLPRLVLLPARLVHDDALDLPLRHNHRDGPQRRRPLCRNGLRGARPRPGTARARRLDGARRRGPRARVPHHLRHLLPGRLLLLRLGLALCHHHDELAHDGPPPRADALLPPLHSLRVQAHLQQVPPARAHGGRRQLQRRRLHRQVCGDADVCQRAPARGAHRARLHRRVASQAVAARPPLLRRLHRRLRRDLRGALPHRLGQARALVQLVHRLHPPPPRASLARDDARREGRGAQAAREAAQQRRLLRRRLDARRAQQRARVGRDVAHRLPRERRNLARGGAFREVAQAAAGQAHVLRPAASVEVTTAAHKLTHNVHYLLRESVTMSKLQG
mmetsp:Transcript_46613/g.152628  ORF Transcript_46613/g.152628 Transcript_46613/m.152628 type:complete len:332 (-) Transcript_46613:273-1268(-)